MRRPRAERRREPRLARSAAAAWDWSKACPAPGPPVVCAFNGQACADRVASGPSKYLLLSKAASGRAELLVVALHRERDDRAAPEGGAVAVAVVAAVQLDPEGEQSTCDEDCEGGEAPCQHDHVPRVAAAAFENLQAASRASASPAPTSCTCTSSTATTGCAGESSELIRIPLSPASSTALSQTLRSQTIP